MPRTFLAPLCIPSPKFIPVVKELPPLGSQENPRGFTTFNEFVDNGFCRCDVCRRVEKDSSPSGQFETVGKQLLCSTCRDWTTEVEVSVAS
jgi:hypothetical protein